MAGQRWTSSKATVVENGANGVITSTEEELTDPKAMFDKLHKKALDLGLKQHQLSMLQFVKDVHRARRNQCLYYLLQGLVTLSSFIVVGIISWHTDWPVNKHNIAKMIWKMRGANTKVIDEKVCLVKAPKFMVTLARPPFDCDFCQNVSRVDRVSGITPSEFEERYAYTGRPVVITDCASDWSAVNVFSFNFFKEIYKPGSPVLESRCQFFRFSSDFETLADLFQMDEERTKLRDGSVPWYVGWSNCDTSVATKLRQHYSRPYFLPSNSESSTTDWIFMGSPGYGATLHVDNVFLPSWQAQIVGHKIWTLESPPECSLKCVSQITVNVHPGEISTSEKAKVTETLKRCWSMIEPNLEENGLYLLREMFRRDPDIMPFYPFYKDEWSKISYADYRGIFPEQGPVNWFLIFSADGKPTKEEMKNVKCLEGHYKCAHYGSCCKADEEICSDLTENCESVFHKNDDKDKLCCDALNRKITVENGLVDVCLNRLGSVKWREHCTAASPSDKVRQCPLDTTACYNGTCCSSDLEVCSNEFQRCKQVFKKGEDTEKVCCEALTNLNTDREGLLETCSYRYSHRKLRCQVSSEQRQTVASTGNDESEWKTVANIFISFFVITTFALCGFLCFCCGRNWPTVKNKICAKRNSKSVASARNKDPAQLLQEVAYYASRNTQGDESEQQEEHTAQLLKEGAYYASRNTQGDEFEQQEHIDEDRSKGSRNSSILTRHSEV